MSRDPVAVAEDALRLLEQGFETGDFAAYLELLTDDFTFWVPAGPMRGMHIGRDAAARNYAFVSAAPGTRIQFSPPFSVTRNDSTVVFELEDEGTILGRPFQNRIALAFEVRDGRISGFREYVGDVSPGFLSMLAEPNGG